MRIDLKSARAQLGALVDQAAAGEKIMLTKRGVDVAMLVPISPPEAAPYTMRDEGAMARERDEKAAEGVRRRKSTKAVDSFMEGTAGSALFPEDMLEGVNDVPGRKVELMEVSLGKDTPNGPIKVNDGARYDTPGVRELLNKMATKRR